MSTLFFRCERCNTLDHMKACPPCSGGHLICYRCQFGSWHNVFEEVTYDSSFHDVVNPTPDSTVNKFTSYGGGGPAVPWDYDN